MTLTEEAAQAAERAAGLIAERGHCKYHYEDKKGSLCVLGALEVALAGRVTRTHFDGYSHVVYTRVVEEYQAQVGTWPAVFNDLDDTTGEDVILGFKRVAEALRS